MVISVISMVFSDFDGDFGGDFGDFGYSGDPKLSLNRVLSQKECFIWQEDNYETFGGTFMYYRDTY